MKEVRLGDTETFVSPLCLGTMNFGSRDDFQSSFNILDYYYQAGGSFIDTANSYSFWIPGCVGGESEELLGRWMKKRNNRKDLFIASKVGFAYPGTEFGLKPNLIKLECEKSLKRLNIETIDLYYAHVDDKNTLLEDTLDAFNDLIEVGKVRYIGASNFLTWRIEQSYCISQINNLKGFCCIQQRYSYIPPNPLARFDPQVSVSDELLDYCINRKITLLAYSTLLKGAYNRTDRELPDQYKGPHVEELLNLVKSIACEVGATPNQVIIAWMINNYPPIIPVVAASTINQIQENCKSLKVSLEQSHMDRLNSALKSGSAW